MWGDAIELHPRIFPINGLVDEWSVEELGWKIKPHSAGPAAADYRLLAEPGRIEPKSVVPPFLIASVHVAKFSPQVFLNVPH